MRKTIYLTIFPILFASISCFSKKTNQQAPHVYEDCVVQFFRNTEWYARDTASFKFRIKDEKSKYVNQRNDIDWKSLEERILEYYVENTLEAYKAPIIDLFGKDSVCALAASKNLYADAPPYTFNKIFNSKRNIRLEIDTLFFRSLIQDRDKKLNARLEDDCLRFREGAFELRVSDLFTFKMDRSGLTQHLYSDHDDDQWKFDLEWLSNNRFLEMSRRDTNLVTIYETTDSSYYFVSQKLNYDGFYEGYVVKM